MHSVEVQVKPRDGRVVAHVIRLAGVDDLGIAQGAAPNVKVPAHTGNACRLQPPRQERHTVGVKRGITATGKDQVAHNLTVLHAARGQHAGHEPVVRAQGIKRICRRERLGDRGRRQPTVGIHFFQNQTCPSVDHRKSHGSAKLRLLHQSLCRALDTLLKIIGAGCGSKRPFGRARAGRQGRIAGQSGYKSAA